MADFERLTVHGDDNFGTYEIFKIDASVFSINTILKTTYWFTDRCYIQLEYSVDKKFICVILRPKDESQALDSSIPGDFANALIDHSLRALVHEETKDIQTIIVRRAFAEALPKKEKELFSKFG